MTGFILTIGMPVRSDTTLVTFRNYFLADALTQPFIKNKILTLELIGKPKLFYSIRIIDNTTYQVKNIFETIVQHIGAGFFTAYTTCAVQ